MGKHWNTLSTLAVVVAMAVIAFLFLPGCNVPPDELLVTPAPIPTPTLPPQGYLSIRISSVEGVIGDVVEAEVLVAGADFGVSGFRVVVIVEDGAIAQIVDMELETFGLVLVREMPAASVEVIVVDMVGMLEGPLDAAQLATIDVELLSEGFTVLTVDVLQIDDDLGGIMLPWVYPGTIKVAAAEVAP